MYAIRSYYALNNQNEFKIEYQVTTSKTTVINMTSHAYFNLNGAGKGKVLDHTLQIKAEKFSYNFV